MFDFKHKVSTFDTNSSPFKFDTKRCDFSGSSVTAIITICYADETIEQAKLVTEDLDKFWK